MSTPEDRSDGIHRTDDSAPRDVDPARDGRVDDPTRGGDQAQTESARPVAPHTEAQRTEAPSTQPVPQHPQEAPTQRIAPAATQALPQASGAPAPAPRPADPFAVPTAPAAAHAQHQQPGRVTPHQQAAQQHPQPPYPGPQAQPSHQPSARPTVSWGAPTPAPAQQHEQPSVQHPRQGAFAGPYGQPADPEHANGGPEYPAAFGAPAAGDQQPPQGKKQRNPVLIPIVATAVVTALLATGGSALVFNAMKDDSSTGSANIATLGQSSADGVPVSGSSVENPDWQAVAAAVKNSVVAIQVATSAGEAEGSGVIADADGNIITNNHVVAGAQDDKVQVTLSDGRIYTADVVGTDTTTDLAVIRLQDPPDDLSPAAMAEKTPTVGDPVMAVGNPLGLANTVTTGIVSALDRPVSTTESGSSETVVTNAIQIDAAVNPGNSGGPLFNAAGEVIGITSSIATTSSASGSIGLGFAIPITLAQSVAGQLVKDGVAEHAFLGVGLTDGTATADGVTRAGAQVQSVSGGSPAAKAGLANGDVIVAIDDKVVAGAESLTGYVRTHASGDKVTLTVVRDGKSMSVEVTLAVREEEGASSGGSGQGGQQGGGQGQGGQNGQGDGSDGSGNGLENMTPEQLWQWFQQQQQQQGGDQG